MPEDPIIHYYNSYLFAKGNEVSKIKVNNKNVNFPTQFCLASISNGFSATESREVSLNGNVYDFSVDDEFDILNIHKYLMTKINIKQCFTLLNECLPDYLGLVNL